MRELMIRLNHPREERGVAAVFFGLAIVVLIAGLGLSIDVGNVAYQRNKAQAAVDNAARDLARSCAQSPTGAECTGLQSAASTIAGKSFDGGTVVASRPAAGEVKVTVEKEIETPLLSAIGITSKRIAAQATASTQSGYPKEGYPVLPLGVGYCTWKNNSGSAGTATESSNKLVLRTDTLQAVKNLVSPLTSGLLTVLPVDRLLSMLLGVGATESCTSPAEGQLLTLSGAVWLTGENVLTTLLSGVFSWDANSCRLRTGSDLLALVGALEGAVTIPTACAQKFGPGKDVMVGKTILLPVYVPRSNLQNAGLNLLSACTGLSILTSKYAKTCVEVPPKIGVDIVGYAPFKVTGWNYPGTPTGYNDGSVACVTKTGALDLGNVINSILTPIEYLLNVVGSLLTLLLGPSSKLTFSLACNGLQGYFTKSFTKDPNFQYSADGADLGATYSRLVN